MLRNILSNWFGLVVLGVISVILTPAMIHGLGNMYYGMWALVGSLVDYSGLLDMGMRATLFRYVAYFRGANQRAGLNQTFATGVTIALCAMFLCALGFIGLAVALPPFFKFAGTDKVVFSKVILLMGASVSLALPTQFLSAYLRGLERFDLYNLGVMVHAIVRATLLLALLKLGFGIIPVAMGVLASEVFVLMLYWVLVKRADPGLKVSLDHLTWKQTREMCNFGFYSFVTNSGETLRYSTDSFVIGRMLTVALVTPFNVATRLTEYFKALIGGVSGPIMVRLSSLTGKNQEDELREEFLRSTRFSMLLSILVGGVMILDGKTLIRIWMGPEYLVSYPILVVLTVAYIVTWGQIACQLLIFARARHHKSISWWTLGEGLANLCLSMLWAPRFGLLGVAMGTAVPLVASKLLVQPWYVLKDLRMTVWTYFKGGLLRSLVVGGIFLGGSWIVTRSAPAPVSFSGLAKACAWQTAAFAAMAYLFGLAEVDKLTVRAQGRRVAMSLGLLRSS